MHHHDVVAHPCIFDPAYLLGRAGGSLFSSRCAEISASPKLSGIFRHRPLDPNHPLLRGFDEVFYMPHSRYTEVREYDIDKVSELYTLALSETAGAAIVATRDARQVFVTGHCEYDRCTLANEYQRDIKRGINPAVPQHYFPDDNPESVPPMLWRGHANLLISNWLNYFVYQQTPYDFVDAT